jgi:hypothetical protein
MSADAIKGAGRIVKMLARSNARLLLQVARLEREVVDAHHLAYQGFLTGRA